MPQQTEKPLDDDLDRRLRHVHDAAASQLAREPVALDVRGLSSITDALYVCHGDSQRAVEAIVDAILRRLAEVGTKAPHVEGKQALQWVLVDLGDLMVHVFLKERREYYNLERLWHDARPVELPG